MLCLIERFVKHQDIMPLYRLELSLMYSVNLIKIGKLH
jgi:hypothetical protein